MIHYRSHKKEFLVGAVLGSLIGGAAALLSAPKTGKRLRSDLLDTYEDISEKAHDFAEKGKSFANSLGSQSNHWFNNIKTTLNGTKKGKHGKHHEENRGYQELLIGGLAGGVIGAAIALLMAPKSGHKLRENLMDSYEDLSDRAHDFAHDAAKKGKYFAKKTQSRANKWLDIAKDIIDGLADDAHDKSEAVVDRAKEFVNHRRIHDVMDWAALGVKVWQGLTKK